ncbi:MAG: hypothetical protein JW791_02835 [Nanoarchaeota archaeon]|nr:hypothetical protein [Nanoarchaeota archaeon]
MKRFVPHITCKRVEQTGVTCLKILKDYTNGVGVYEKKINDYSATADKANKLALKDSPWSSVTIYDLAGLALKDFNVIIVKESDSFPADPSSSIEEYTKKKLEALKIKPVINEDIENELVKQLKDYPVALLINLNELYHQRNLGIGWVVITEYNPDNNEFIVYDPMYYTRLPRGGSWERLPNTPRRRFIRFNINYFLSVWRKTKETVIFSKIKAQKKGFSPFLREFFAITKKDI